MSVNIKGRIVGSIKGEQKVKGTANVGRASKGIDVTGAEVGQIVKIAEVDLNGKPTKWEATDMPVIPELPDLSDDEMTALEDLIEVGLIDPVATNDDTILIDENGYIYIY